MTNKFAVESPLLNDAFELEVMPLRFAATIGDIGRFSIGKIARSFVMAAKLGWRLMTSRPDAVYFTLSPVGGAFLRDLLLVAVMKFFMVTRIYHLRGKGIQKACGQKGWLVPLYHWAFAGAEVIHLSELLYFDIAPFVPRDKLHLVANGRPDHGEAGIDRQDHTDPPTILFVSNMLEAKGPLVLLRALARLRNEGVEYVARFVGPWMTPAFEKEWRTLHQHLQLEESVHYSGALFDDALMEAYRQADILAFPTLNECFPGVVLEAMSHGLPVVSSAEGALPEIIEEGKTGLLFTTNDDTALAGKLKMLIGCRNIRLEMGAAARTRFVDHYTLPAFEARLRDALQHCLHAPSVAR